MLYIKIFFDPLVNWICYLYSLIERLYLYVLIITNYTDIFKMSSDSAVEQFKLYITSLFQISLNSESDVFFFIFTIQEHTIFIDRSFLYIWARMHDSGVFESSSGSTVHSGSSSHYVLKAFHNLRFIYCSGIFFIFSRYIISTETVSRIFTQHKT